MPEWLNVTDIATGVAVAGVVAVVGVVALLVKRLGSASYQALQRKRPTTLLMSAKSLNALWVAVGESTLWKLESSWVGDDGSRSADRLVVEIEAHDGGEVWSVGLPPETNGTDLALAARVRLELMDQFYRLHHVGTHRDLVPDQPVLSQVSPGDRLRMLPNGSRIWGIDRKLGPIDLAKAFLRRLVSKNVRID